MLWMFLTLAPHWKLCNRNLLGNVVHGILELTCKVFWKCVTFGQPLPGAPLLQRFFSGEFSPAIPTCASWIWQVSNNHSFAYPFTILFFLRLLCIFFPFGRLCWSSLVPQCLHCPTFHVTHYPSPLSSHFLIFLVQLEDPSKWEVIYNFCLHRPRGNPLAMVLQNVVAKV